MDNLIQVFGLPRSGTNFVEWSLNNNFENINYKNCYSICDSDIQQKGKRIALKHCLPNLTRSMYCIVIYKSYEDWKASMRKDGKGSATKECLDSYIKVAEELPSNKVIIIQHKYFVDNYFKVLKLISDKFKVKMVDNPVQPLYRLNKGGAMAKQTKQKYE